MPDFDENVRKALEEDEFFKGIVQQLKEAASATTTYVDRNPAGCPKCDCKHFRTVEVPDYSLKLKIIDFLAQRGVGRPGQADSEDSEKIVFIREVRK